MSVTALALITDAFMDLGIYSQGETPSAPDTQLALRILNRMVNGWQTQSLTVTAIQRMLFPLIANKQTYTIGPGADLDIPRPVRLSGAGLLLAGLSATHSITSITSSGFVATVTQTTHGYSVGDEVFIDGATQTSYNGVQTVESVPTSGTWTFILDDVAVSPATGTKTAAKVLASGVEIPRALYTDDGYEAIQIKRLSNSLFTGVYYNATASPFGQVVLWPIPDNASNQLVLYVPQVFGSFANLSATYSWPDTPGYQDALIYNLETRLIGPFGVGNPVVTQTAQMQAAKALGLIKRQNYKLSDMPIDPALTRSYGGGYNINTGTGGGTN
jgi:hypothetical protein